MDQIMQVYENQFNESLNTVPLNSLAKADQRTQLELYSAQEIIAVHSKFAIQQIDFKEYKAFMQKELSKRVKDLMEGVHGSLATLDEPYQRDRKPTNEPMPAPTSNNPFRQQLQQPVRDNKPPSGGQGLHIPNNISPIHSGIHPSTAVNDKAIRDLESQLRSANASADQLKTDNQSLKKLIEDLKQDKKKLEQELAKEKSFSEKLVKDEKRDNQQTEEMLRRHQDQLKKKEAEIEELASENERLYEELKNARSNNRSASVQPPSEEPVLREKIRQLNDKISKLESENQSQREGTIE